MTRSYNRKANGRFGMRSLREVTGLDVLICQDCRRMNPYPATGEKPTECHACGSENLT
jgi:hypothetical protein